MYGGHVVSERLLKWKGVHWMRVATKKDGDQDLKYVRLQVPHATHRALRILAAKDEKSIARYTRDLVTRVVKLKDVGGQ